MTQITANNKDSQLNINTFINQLNTSQLCFFTFMALMRYCNGE